MSGEGIPGNPSGREVAVAVRGLPPGYSKEAIWAVALHLAASRSRPITALVVEVLEAAWLIAEQDAPCGCTEPQLWDAALELAAAQNITMTSAVADVLRAAAWLSAEENSGRGPLSQPGESS